MKLPDKIYLGVGPMSDDEPNKRYIYAEWNEEPRPLVQNIAYIRKDALLEWANGKMTIEGATEGIVGGYDLALKDLIKHIESL